MGWSIALNFLPSNMNKRRVRWQRINKNRIKSSTTKTAALVLLIQGSIYIFYQCLCTLFISSSEQFLRPWEGPILLDMRNFEWVMINNQEICRMDLQNVGVRLMPILVHSARTNFLERHLIRSTIGNIVYRGWITNVVFLLGISKHANQTEEVKIGEEQSTYGDIVMGNFIDTYHNLTYKAMMGYKWILNFCPNASFVLKIDDQVFVDVTKWLDWRINDLEQLDYWENENFKVMRRWRMFRELQDWRIVNSSLTRPHSLSVPNNLYCLLAPIRARPYRKKGHKYYVSEEEWPDKWYPPYCVGVAWGITVNIIRKIYEAHFEESRRLWHDDVFVTGVLMERAQKKYDIVFLSNFRDIRPHYTYFTHWKQKGICLNTFAVNQEESVKGKRLQQPKVVYAEISRGKKFEDIWMCLWYKTLGEAKQRVLILGPNRNQTKYVMPI